MDGFMIRSWKDERNNGGMGRWKEGQWEEGKMDWKMEGLVDG